MFLKTRAHQTDLRARMRGPAAVLLALSLLLVATPAVAEDPSPGTPPVHESSQPLAQVPALPDAPAATAAVGAGAVVALAEAELDGPTAVAGLTWPSGSPTPDVWYRTIESGVATSWEKVEVLHDEPDEGASVDGTPAIIVSGADSLQVATVSTRPLASDLFVSSSPEVSGDAAAAEQPEQAAAAPTRPVIRARTAWGADETITGLPYEYGIVSGAMVHHDAGTNDYTPAQVPGILRSIQAFHVNGRGWKDVAYNVLVDKYGTAWEGRGGGVERAVEGGHGSGETNTRVFGLSLLGHYDKVEPSAAMMAKAADVIAWKFALHGVDPFGTTWGSGGQGGGSTHLEAISGHRDENATSCPGHHVYQRLPQLRRDVASRLAGVDYQVTQPQATPMSQQLPAPDVRTGKVRLVVDGVLGLSTVTQLQLWLGVDADAVWQRGTTRALQAKLGVPTTGARDVVTMQALQRLVGAPLTGLLDAATVRGLQSHLNRQPAPHAPVGGSVVYTPYVHRKGWLPAVADGATAGTTGEGLRLEAFRLSLADLPQAGGIEYRGHVQKLGWQPWIDTSSYIGTTRNRLRLEAFQIRLTGEITRRYRIEYRAHVSGIGWQGWVNDGATAGTTGQGATIEAIQVRLVSNWAPVTAEPVVFTDRCGTAEDTFTVPSVPGVQYWVGSTLHTAATHPGRGTVTVEARALPGRELVGTARWRHTFGTGSLFADVTPRTQFYNEICWVASSGIATGWTEANGRTTYRPLEPIRRDAMAAFLHRLAGEPTVTLPARSPFADVKPGDQFYAEMVWMHQQGISTGWSTSRGREYRPLEPVNRDAMAAFLYRFAGSPSFVTPRTSPFTDLPVGAQFYKEMAWLADEQISTGWQVGRGREYRPLQPVNRDAMAAFMHRLKVVRKLV